MSEALPRFSPLKLGVEMVEGYVPLDAPASQKRLLRQNIGQAIAAKLAELDAFEMVPGPGGVWVLRCRLVIHFSGVAVRAGASPITGERVEISDEQKDYNTKVALANLDRANKEGA